LNLEHDSTIRRFRLIASCSSRQTSPVRVQPTDDSCPDSGGKPRDLPALFGPACVVGGLFALIALMPSFDGDRDRES
jgi:hypothetical protein